MTPVKVTMVEKLCNTFKLQLEWDVLPTLYSIVLFLEFPATLILPFNFTLKPLIPI